MIRSNYYEVAFEAYLKSRKLGYVCVDEARRSQFGETSYKSLDFLVVGPHAGRLAVDVKGRRFPGGTLQKPIHTWQNWAEADDIRGLVHWAEHLGGGFEGILAFVYHLQPGYVLPPDTPDLFHYRENQFLIRAVNVRDYRQHMRPRSPRWQTVHLPTAVFREVVRPFSAFLEKRE